MFDPCSCMKVLGSWCDDKGGSTGALVASIQTGNSAFYKHETVLKDRELTIAGRIKAFQAASVASTMHGMETLHLDSADPQKAQGLGGTLHQNNETKQERQLGDT